VRDPDTGGVHARLAQRGPQLLPKSSPPTDQPTIRTAAPSRAAADRLVLPLSRRA